MGRELITENEYRKRREGMTKGAKTKALKSGAAKYRTPQAKAAVAYKARTADLVRAIRGLAPRDKRVMDAWRREGFRALSEAEKPGS